LKYLDGQPLVGVNPDPARGDGVLLPFAPRDVARLLPGVLGGQCASRAVGMAEARLGNGQSLLAVNDLFIGPKSHTSARYEIEVGERREVQSSSGVIVSTGMGSTGWMRSVITGALAVTAFAAGSRVEVPFQGRPWEDEDVRAGLEALWRAAGDRLVRPQAAAQYEPGNSRSVRTLPIADWPGRTSDEPIQASLRRVESDLTDDCRLALRWSNRK